MSSYEAIGSLPAFPPNPVNDGHSCSTQPSDPSHIEQSNTPNQTATTNSDGIWKAAEDGQEENKIRRFSPSLMSSSHAIYNCAVKKIVPIMDLSAAYYGPVLNSDSGAKRYNTFSPVDSTEGLCGEAAKVVVKVIDECTLEILSDDRKKILKADAQRLAKSCAKLWVKWEYQGENTVCTTAHSGFWVKSQSGDRFFLTVVHFLHEHNEPNSAIEKRMKSLQAAASPHKTWVDNKLMEEERSPRAVEVKLLAWDCDYRTAIFKADSHDTDIHNSVSLDEIGFVYKSLLKKIPVFTAGYCADDIRISRAELLRRGFSPFDAEWLINTGSPQPFTLFACLKICTRESFGRDQVQRKATPAEAAEVKFTDVFRPNERASTGGYMLEETTDSKMTKSKQHTFIASTTMSLYPGLSGSPVFSFTEENGWKAIGMVKGGSDLNRGNDMLAFKPAFRAMVEGWIETKDL